MAVAMLGRLLDRLARRELPVWYSPAYRLPLSGTDVSLGVQSRRADRALWWLVESRAIRPADVHEPVAISYDELHRVHTVELLESLESATTLAGIFAADPSGIGIDEILSTVRLACGGTLAASRLALQRRGPTLNLLGGFHHAARDAAGRFCPVNDVAVALAALRAEGFDSRVVVLDLAAHPPDGLAACLREDAGTWIGSISGSDREPVPGIDETVLPEGAGDELYLASLTTLLGRMPKPTLAFVLAGGDVLGGDRSGRLGLTLEGARRRDLEVARALEGVPSVWVPAGGYHLDSWRVLAGTGMVLASRSTRPIPRGYDPLTARFARISRELRPDDISETEITNADVEDTLGLASQRTGLRLFLGYYTPAGVEHALIRFGALPFLRRLGYGWFRIVIDSPGLGDRLRLFGQAKGKEHLLVELVVELLPLAGEKVLYVHWLTMRNPIAHFSPARPQLPGQEVPGLGLSRELSEMLALMARRLDCAAVVIRPAHYQMAFKARGELAFIDPGRQGRFEALVRDLSGVPLLEAAEAVSHGQVLLDGKPYLWEADEMALWLEPRDDAGRADAIARERERCRFALSVDRT